MAFQAKEQGGTHLYTFGHFCLIFRSFRSPTFTSRSFQKRSSFMEEMESVNNTRDQRYKPFFHCLSCQVRIGQSVALLTNQGILKGEVSL